MARPYTLLTDSFKILRDNLNTVSYNVGDPVNLLTHGDSDVVMAINEIERVFDASAGEILYPTGNSLQGETQTRLLLSTAQNSGTDITLNAGLDINLDAVGDINLDAGGANINFLDDSVARFNFTLGATNVLDVTGVLDLNISSNLDADIAGNSTLTTTGSQTQEGTSLNLDFSGDITLDADGNDIIFKNGAGGEVGSQNFIEITTAPLKGQKYNLPQLTCVDSITKQPFKLYTGKGGTIANPKFDSTYVTKKDLPVDYQEALFNLPIGGVYGPYVFNGNQCISRMISKKANASAKASHILLAYKGAPQSSATRTKEEAQALANNLLAQVKANPGNFAMLAITNSDDPGSKNNGGEYDNITPGQMVPQFNDFVFNNAIGSIGVVETDYGFHVIKVMDKYNAVLMGTVAQKIQPSDATIDGIYTKASQLEADANENSDFAAIAKKAGLEVVPATNLKGSDEYVQGIGSQREIVRWSFNKDTEIGDVKRFEVPQGFVIAKLKGKNESGLLPIDIARQSVEILIKNQKKTEIIKKKMNGTSLEAVAQNSGASVQPAIGVTLKTPNLPNIGNEPKVIGKAFGLAAGTTSKIIEGNSGMFMIRAKAVTRAPEVPSYTTYITQDRSQNQSYATSKAYTALKDKAEIKDNRANF